MRDSTRFGERETFRFGDGDRFFCGESSSLGECDSLLRLSEFLRLGEQERLFSDAEVCWTGDFDECCLLLRRSFPFTPSRETWLETLSLRRGDLELLLRLGDILSLSGDLCRFLSGLCDALDGVRCVSTSPELRRCLSTFDDTLPFLSPSSSSAFVSFAFTTSCLSPPLS